MQQIIDFFEQNGDWIFGGGGAVAALLAILRWRGSKKDSQTPQEGNDQSIHADNGAEIVIRTKVNRSGLDGMTLISLFVAVLCFVAFTITFGSKNLFEDRECSAGPQKTLGDGNITIGPCAKVGNIISEK